MLGPAGGQRLAYLLAGNDLVSAAGRTAVVYANPTGSALADIRAYDGTQTPGAVIPGSAVIVDAASRLPRFWYPDNESHVWISVNGGPLVELPLLVESVNGQSGVVVLDLSATAQADGAVALDFGAWPGTHETSVAITGQGDIAEDASVEARLSAEASGDHTAADAAYAALFIALTCSPPTAGDGFTVYARSSQPFTGTFRVQWTWSN
jgi:hypothetical protein